MATNARQSEADFLRTCDVAFQNVEENPVIKAALAEVGYDDAKIQEGKDLLSTAQLKYDTNKKEENETSVASLNFKTKKEELRKLYSRHRKIAKVAFMDNPATLILLDLEKPIPSTYTHWLEVLNVFYVEILADQQLQDKLAQLKVTAEQLTQGAELIPEVKKLYATYKDEVGESENATKEKDTAFTALDLWMRTFYKIAAIALEDEPQLLEALGKNVKS
ncbi:MAG: hypothetical protein H0S84_13470 [Bacteroidales bacterium]|nr:hypothetical protein [Bacteroidales bacterium]